MDVTDGSLPRAPFACSEINAHNVTAEIVDELIWMTSFFDDFSCEESKSRNVDEEGEEAVANPVCRWVVRVVCMIICIRKNIFVSQTPFSDPLSFLCRGGKDKCPVSIADLVLLYNKAQEGITKNDALDLIFSMELQT